MMTAKRKPKRQSLSNSYSCVACHIKVESFSENPKLHLELFIGTLVNVNFELNDKFVAIKVVDLNEVYKVSEEELWLCPHSALIHVDKKVWPYLSAIPSPDERVFLLKQNELLEELIKIDVGNLVEVITNENKFRTAMVQFKGPIKKKGPGIYFGVELLEGNCEGGDGRYGNQTYFNCPPGTGMFVSVNKLRPGHKSGRRASYNSVQPNKVPEAEMNKQCYPVLSSSISEKLCDCDKNCDPLCVGDKVVWITDEGEAPGIVKAITSTDSGRLKVHVGFDSPVRNEYCAVVSAFELVKASDFHGREENSKINGDSSWHNGATSLPKEPSSKYNQASLDFITFNNHHQHFSAYEDGASSGSEGSGYYDTPDTSGSDGFTVGSLVEVMIKGEPQYGVIRWIGTVPGDRRARTIAGIEMEEEHCGYGDGSFNGREYFHCNPHRSLFTNLSQCRHDSRFQDSPFKQAPRKSEDFGCVDSPIIPGIIAPISREGNISEICGKFRGIQGHHNSCYLDATLFSMFTFTSVFDSLLYRPASILDKPGYQEVQKVLREEIVNPLRTNLFVRADRIMKLRTLMEQLSSVSGLTTEEKDPEEFLTSLVAQILRAEPFLKLSSGQETYHYQLFVEKDEALTFPSVQQLFEQSFLSSDLKLKEVPSVLIIQMPRFGKAYKMYPRILPSQLLDVTDVIEDSPRQCTVCGILAEYECKQCFQQCDVGLQSISFCRNCLETAHSHERRRNHSWKEITVPYEFNIIKEHCVIPRLYMQLFAVVCIETSHYVSFVKCGTGEDAPWCFFDSMADRKGEQNGYNIPEMVACPDLPFWLSEKGANMLEQIKDERQLPEHAKRLLCDAYMCMYQSTEVMMYR